MEYTLNKDNNRGHDDASSVQIPQGYKVEIYGSDNLTGDPLTLYGSQFNEGEYLPCMSLT